MEVFEIVPCIKCAFFYNDSFEGAYCNHFQRPLHDDYDGYCAWGIRDDA